MLRTLTALLAAGALLAPLTAAAQAPGRLPVQGFLTDAEGAALDGEHLLEFSIFAAADGGEALFDEAQRVQVDAGAFAAQVGDAQDLDLSVFRDLGDLWLEVRVDGDPIEPRFRLGAVPYAGFSAFAGDADSVGGLTADELRGGAWDALEGVPPTLLDGDQDTTYAAGPGLTLADGAFAADFDAVQARLSAACPAGQALSGVQQDGTPDCVPVTAEGAAIIAGSGLRSTPGPNGVTLAIDPAAVQARIAEACGPGEALVGVSAAGAITCVTLATGDITGVSAGAGLSGGGEAGAVSLAVDPTAFQRRVGEPCPAGQAISGIGEGGGRSCIPVGADGDVTAVTAGAGLSGGGAGGDVQLSVDTSAIQARIANPCPAGQAIRSVGANGAPTCVPVGTGDITQVTAGNGLNGGGAEGAVTLAVDTSAIQARLANACPGGQAIASVSAAGAVGCVAVGTGDITRVAVGPGLTGGGQSGDVTIGFDPTALQARVADPCPAGQAIVAIDQNGGRTCGALGTGDITQVTAGNGLIGGGGSGAVALAVDATAFQTRLRNGCPANEAMTGVDQAGNVTCQPVGDIQGVTAGFGLTGGAGSGTATLTVDTNAVQARVVGSCPNAGEFMTAIGNNGQATCANVFGTSEAVTHYGSTGRLGATTLFQPDGADSGVFLEGRSGGEGGGFFANGDTAAIWSPGDTTVRVADTDISGTVLAIYDEDSFGAAEVQARYAFGTFGTRVLAAFNGAYLSVGGVWTNTSDVALKDDFATVDPDAVLEGIGALPITEWTYNSEKDGGFRHLGPMAQDFYDAFGLGYDEKSIPTVDADGVALAGIQALRDRNLKLQARVDELEARLAAIEARLP